VKKILSYTLTTATAIFLSLAATNARVLIKKVKAEAPFKNPAINMPDFSNCPKLNIVDFGAVAGDKTKTSKAIVAAIDSASKIGGGVVVVPEGEWLTGKLHFKSNVNLHLSKGSTLLFSELPQDYLPPVHTTWEGMECYNYSPLIYAYNCKNIAITGQGEVKAKMDIWKTWFSRPKPHMESLKRLYYLASYYKPVEERQMVNDTANFRPHFIQFNRCQNILMDGIKITNSPFWTVHPYMSKHIVIKNLRIWAHGHNNDGIDPEMSQNVLIENCIFDQGDDAISIKAGRNQDAWRLNTPSKYIVIRNCIAKNGHQLLALGSELSGGIEKVYMENCVVEEGAKLNHLLFIKTNERRGGFVKDIYMKNISSGKIDQGILGIETDVLYQWRDLVKTIERRLTKIENINLENFNAGDVSFVSRVLAEKEMPVENVKLINVKALNIRDKKHIHENLENFSEK